MGDEFPEWGRGRRRIVREIKRQVEKEVIRAKADIPESKSDKGLWFIEVLMTLGLLLLAPKLQADITGRTVVVAILVLMFGCSFPPILKRLNSLVGRIVGLLISATLLVAFGCFVWPYTLRVNPSRVLFGVTLPHIGNNETYRFRLENRADEDVYVAEFDFTVDDPKESPNNFKVDISKDSRKPFGKGGAGAENFVDTLGFLCRDSPQKRLVYILSVARLQPHEVREITIAYNGQKTPKILANSGFFSTEPEPLDISGNRVGTAMKFEEHVDHGGCRPFGFLVDEKEYEGMYWFSTPPS